MSHIVTTKDLFVQENTRELVIELPSNANLKLNVFQDINLGNLIELSKIIPIDKNEKNEIDFNIEDLGKIGPKVWSILVKSAELTTEDNNKFEFELKQNDFMNLKIEIAIPIFEKLFNYFAKLQEKTNTLANDDEEKKS